jgi:biofilm PGA synthesis N-glycosyltransferase PgaC
MSLLLTFFVLFYTVFICLAFIGWFRLRPIKASPDHKPENCLSVLIPVRNEAASILKLLTDLAKQSYPKELFEVIIIDDFSEDDTVELVRKFQQNSGLNIYVLELKNGTGTGKKSAIQLGLEKAKGKLIVQTDGDCRVQESWLNLLEKTYSTGNVKFISGPVCLEAGKAWFEKMQVVEFASLIGAGAAAIGLGNPNMCNGANLAYEKGAFYEVNGFAGNEQVASGDDEFLMHKFQKQFPGQVVFLKATEAVVYTPAKNNVRDFISQRVRWASKWRFYRNPASQALAVLVFGTNLLLLLALISWLAGILNFQHFIFPYLLKTAVDLVFLTIILRFLRRQEYLIFTLPLQLLYAPYVVYCALAGLNGQYNWKGRILKNRD